MKAILKTTKGEIEFEFCKETPMTAANFVGLAKGDITGKPFFNGITFHRVIPNFMIQSGDPTGTGTGGPGYQWKDEKVWLKHDRPGTVSMANRGIDSNSSQFFITHVPTPWLDGKHTVFGYVTKGQDVVNRIAQGDKIQEVVITDEDSDVLQQYIPLFKTYI
jgi:cyclophilin family peptidyl-prolyl cis-trans isomerase